MGFGWGTPRLLQKLKLYFEYLSEKEKELISIDQWIYTFRFLTIVKTLTVTSFQRFRILLQSYAQGFLCS